LSDTDYLNLTGIDRDSFDDLCGHVKEVRETKVRSIRTCIGILLTKLKSGMSNALLSTMFNMSVAATQRSISTARNALTKHFTPNYIGFNLRNQPISNKNCLWWACLLTDRDEMSILYRGPSIAATYQVSVHFAKWFQRRRFFMNWLISKKYSQPTEPLVYILYCTICMLMFHHACLSFSIKSLRNSLR
jgi:hypothetical protein